MSSVAADAAKEAKMKLTDMRILIVADDPQLTASLAKEAVCGLNANVTIVNSVEEARNAAAPDSFDVVLASETLPDGNGLELLKAKGGSIDAPVILICDDLDANRILQAMRNGAADVIARPADRKHLVASLRRAAARQRRRKHAAARSRRLRRISSRLVRDRRELRQRVDLICRDLVSAYQRLAHKVVGTHDGALAGDGGADVEPYDPRA